MAAMSRAKQVCRLCSAPLRQRFVDLGATPLCENYLDRDQLEHPEISYPLVVFLCEQCLLVQLPEHVAPEQIFRHYAYFSSYSQSWVEHARRFVDTVAEQHQLGPDHFVVEIASNDGYLLQFVRARGIRCLGVDPAQNIAAAARERGVETLVAFFSPTIAEQIVTECGAADLIVANNVLAQVSELHPFVAAMHRLLAPRGLVCLEFPHVQQMVDGNQFDTIYHEHYSYFSLLTACRLLEQHGLVVTDVEALPSHGGSLRVFARHQAAAETPTPRVAQTLAAERAAGLHAVDGYARFAPGVLAAKHQLLRFLLDARERGERVAGYGAPGKGNTLLNVCGIRPDLLEFTVDRNPYKQGRYLPGSRIPVLAPEALAARRPDWILILPWNLEREIRQQLGSVNDWGARYVIPIPQLRISA